MARARRANKLILRFTLNVDDEDKDDLEYEDNDNVSDDNDDLVDDEDDAEQEYNAESEEIGAKIFQSEQSSSAWEEVINKYKDIASITHDVEKFSWVHIVYNRRSEAEKVDLVHVISEAVQEISIQGDQSGLVAKVFKSLFRDAGYWKGDVEKGG